MAEAASSTTQLAAVPSSNVVKEAEWVFLKTNDEKQLFMEASKNKSTKLGRVHCNLGPLVGAKYGSIFEVQGSKLVQVYDGLVPSLSAKDLQFSKDKKMPTNDNRDIVDNNTAQKLSQDEIQLMKGKGMGGKQIIEALVASSDTYNKKTGFSQEKYLKKKLKKYMVRVQVVKPTGHIVGETCFMRAGLKMCNMREDSLAQLLTYANVHANQQVLVHETCMGVLMGAVAERLGGYGRALCSYSGQQSSRDAVRRFNLSPEADRALVPFPLEWINILDQDEAVLAAAEQKKIDSRAKYTMTPEETKAKEARLAKFTKAQQEKHRLRKEAREKRKSVRSSDAQIRTWLRNKSDCLIIASNHDPTSMLMALLPLLKTSCPFAVFCEFREPLTRCYDAVLKLGTVISLQLSNTWCREFQVLPNRTHPLNDMHSESGYILTGIKVHVNKRSAEHTAKFGTAPAWKRRQGDQRAGSDGLRSKKRNRRSVAEDSKAEDSKAEDSKAEDSKAEDSKAEDSKGDVKSEK